MTQLCSNTIIYIYFNIFLMGVDEAKKGGVILDELKFWGKTNPYKSLIHHMIDSGAVAKILLTEGLMNSTYVALKSFFKDDDKLLNTVAFYVSLHDLGKCHHDFQNKYEDDFIIELRNRGLILSDNNLDYRHEIGTKMALKDILDSFNFNDDDLLENVRDMLCYSLRLHHQRKPSDPNNQRIKYRKDYWISERKNIFDLLCNLFDAKIEILKECSNCGGAGVLLWGLTVLSDWLASGQEEILFIDENLSLQDYFKKSEEMARLVVKKVGLKIKKTLPKANFCGLWKNFTKDSLRPLQLSCEKLAKEFQNDKKIPGLIILEAPMGEGKTEAALFLASHLIDAYNKNGLYIAMPTAATSNQMHNRLSNLLEDHNLKDAKLIHSTSWLIEKNTNNYDGEEEDENAQSSWLAPSRRAILSQFGVGTIDQIMMGVLKIKYTSIRLLGMESKVIIMDEVHAYDIYMYTIIERLIKWCANLNIPVILLSATLPSVKKESMIKAYGGEISNKLKESYPLITTVYKGDEYKQIEVNGSFMSSTVKISLIPYMGKWNELSDKALSMVEDGGCLCVLLNTVKEAQEFYTELIKKNNDKEIELSLFHARFPAEDRQRIEDKCVDDFGKKSLLSADDKDYTPRPKKAILVATQVVEQSLDLDFDCMLIALAPIDLLLQRIGRVHRHIRKRPTLFIEPKVEILVSEMPIDKTSNALVYNSWILIKTEEVLKDREEIKLPKDIRPLVEYVYNATSTPDDKDYKKWIELITEADVDELTAKRYTFGEPNEDKFFIQNVNEHFFDDEESAINENSKTRIGDSSIRIAIIQTDLIKKQKDIKRPTREFAEEVLKRAVSIRGKEIMGCSNFDPPIEGNGFLKGIWILPSDNKKYSCTLDKKNKNIIEDEILGIILEEGYK